VFNLLLLFQGNKFRWLVYINLERMTIEYFLNKINMCCLNFGEIYYILFFAFFAVLLYDKKNHEIMIFQRLILISNKNAL
jgi:hypothetical protein